MWDLPGPGLESVSPCIGRQILNHCATREVQSVFLHINLFILFILIFGCVGSLLLRGAFSSCGEQGLLFVAVRGLLIAVASLVVEHGL